jgi:hypothetical protein
MKYDKGSQVAVTRDKLCRKQSHQFGAVNSRRDGHTSFIYSREETMQASSSQPPAEFTALAERSGEDEQIVLILAGLPASGKVRRANCMRNI